VRKDLWLKNIPQGLEPPFAKSLRLSYLSMVLNTRMPIRN